MESEQLIFEGNILPIPDPTQVELNAGEDALIAPEPNPHKHRWVIETPNGPTSKGCCHECGGEKEFKNWLEKYDKSLFEREFRDHR